jgi:hypothetical protein
LNLNNPTAIILRNLLSVAAALLLTCSAAAQLPSADEIAQSGNFDGQLYTNKVLGLTILAPGGWTFYTYSQNQEIVAANRGKNANASSANTQVLFQATPPKALNPNKSAIFSSGIERLTKTLTGEQYAKANKDLVLSASPVVLTKDVYETKLGGALLYAFEITGKQGTDAYRQTYLVTVRKGVAVFFVETFYDNKNVFAIEASLKTLKFGK